MMKSLPHYVRHDVMTHAGFNGYDPSIIETIDNETRKIYLSRKEELNLNYVLIERQIGGETIWRAWYLGFFDGKSLAECKTQEETNNFYKKINEIITKRKRVSCNDLEWLISVHSKELQNANIDFLQNL